MCKFTYLGYDRCDEPERHYLVRREKCSAKAHLKHWCAPHEQEEAPTANQQGKFWVSLPCPMCADTPVVYDQPLLEIAHSRRSVLPAPHYDAVTRKYTRLPKHQTPPEDLPESVVPRPLNTTRMQVRRAAAESTVTKAKASEQVDLQNYILPATTYIPPQQELKLPKPLPIPQPVTLTPPSSREGSRSPPQIRMAGALRTTPPGEGNRRELDSIREKARAAADTVAKESRPATPDRSQSGSASSSSTNESSQATRPSRHASNASTATATSLSSRATTTSTSTRTKPQWQGSPSRPEPQDSIADTLANVALRSIGIDRSMSRSASPSASPERGRKPRRRPTGGSSSERSDSPSVWRPTISPPVLQNDSLGIGPAAYDVEPFKQRLVPLLPSKAPATANGASVAKGEGLVEDPPRPRTPHPHSNKPPALSLFPNAADDEEVAAAAFERMFAAEARALAHHAQAQAKAQADAQAQVATQIQARTTSEAAGGAGGQGGATSKKDKVLPSVPAPLRRIISGQVRTVNVPPPRPLRRQNTADGAVSAASSSKSSPQPGGSFMKVKPGPLFSFAGVGGKAQEFEIVTGPDGSILQEPAFGQAF